MKKTQYSTATLERPDLREIAINLRATREKQNKSMFKIGYEDQINALVTLAKNHM